MKLLDIVSSSISLSLVCFRSGSVCLDVINQTWSPMFGNNQIKCGWFWKFLESNDCCCFWRFDLTFLCLDLLFFFADLVNVFETFLPQLLLYPNPSDPLNGEAAALMMRDRPAYEQRVKGISNQILSVKRYVKILKKTVSFLKVISFVWCEV